MNLKTDAKDAKKKSYALLLPLILFSCISLFSQHQNFSQLNISAGLTTGTPIILKDIPEGASGRPGFGMNVGLEYRYTFHPKFSLTIGATYAQKGSHFSSPISGKYDAARGVFGESFPFPLRVGYTGNVTASFKNIYLDFPVLGNIHLKKWRIGLGYQYSRLLKGGLGGSVDVQALFMDFENQPFDDSKNIKNYDNMVIIKLERQLSNRIYIGSDFTISTQRLMIQEQEGFKNPRNVYANLVLGFRLF